MTPPYRLRSRPPPRELAPFWVNSHSLRKLRQTSRTSLTQGRLIGSRPMETASIRQLSDRLYPVMLSLPSRKFTPLLVGRVDSRVPRGALPCTARTSWHPVPTERTSPSAHSTGPLLPLVQPTESSQHSHGEATPSRGV